MRINPMILNIKLNCNTYICIYSTRYRMNCSPPPHHGVLRGLRALTGSGEARQGSMQGKEPDHSSGAWRCGQPGARGAEPGGGAAWPLLASSDPWWDVKLSLPSVPPDKA